MAFPLAEVILPLAPTVIVSALLLSLMEIPVPFVLIDPLLVMLLTAVPLLPVLISMPFPLALLTWIVTPLSMVKFPIGLLLSVQIAVFLLLRIISLEIVVSIC